MIFTMSVYAEETPNEKQARRIFDEAFQKVFGDEGASLDYKVNIFGIYKVEGSIWYKGKKQHFVSKNEKGWNDGKLAYIVKERKKEVLIYNPNQKSKREKNFEFKGDDYKYHIANDPNGLLITLKAKKGVKGMKEVKALLDRHSYAPIHIKIKVGIIWANIHVANFKSGNINEDMFIFPKSKYSQYKFVDKRNSDD